MIAAVGFIAAQEECLKLIESMYRAEDESERPNLERIEQEVNENIISGQTFVRNLRNTYPEILSIYCNSTGHSFGLELRVAIQSIDCVARDVWMVGRLQNLLTTLRQE